MLLGFPIASPEQVKEALMKLAALKVDSAVRIGV
jgi:hypothetical protein